MCDSVSQPGAHRPARLLLAWMLLLAIAAPSALGERPSGKLLLAHFMPWYTTPDVRGAWGGHWTGFRGQHDPETLDENGLPDLWSHHRPLIGPYDSTDADVLECQLLQMRLAGIDGVIVDWYGIGQAADYPDNHDGARALFEATAALGMRFAVCFEDRTVERLIDDGVLDRDAVAAHLAETIEWLDENWFGAEHYVRVRGRPLLLNFGPVFVRDPAVWREALVAAAPRPAFFALHHLWRDAGADGGFTWVHERVWAGSPTEAEIRDRLVEVHTRTSADADAVIPSALPGYHDIYDHSLARVDHRGGATLRESLAVCMAGPWPIVQLVTWNDYGEGTMLEPTHGFGYLFLEIVQEARRAELGAAFGFGPEDLRLPARLLALRRSGEVERARLDEIAGALASGACDRARSLLTELEPSPSQE